MLLHDAVFAVTRRTVEFETFHSWIEFIVRVVNDGAASETRTNLRGLLDDILKNADTASRAQTSTGARASVLFQNMMRDRFNPLGSTELARLSAKEREQALNRDVLRTFRNGLPQPCSWDGDERGVFVQVEPPPVLEPAPLMKKVFGSVPSQQVTAQEAERISQAATENETKCLAVIAALAVDSHARRLRRCNYDGCQRYTFGNRALRRKHAFCSDDHKSAYHRERRDKQKHAAAMRGYRQLPQVKMRERKRR